MSEKKVGKRLLTWVLVLVMTLSLLPLNVLADEVNSPLPGEVTATKSCTAMPDEDGNYTITLTVQGNPVPSTDTTMTPANADVVLVVDNSGSMSTKTGESCNTQRNAFVKKEAGYTYDTYTCPKCGAKYIEFHWGFSNVPDVCTGQISRINAAKQVSMEFASSILSHTGNQVAVIGFSHGNRNGGTDENAIKVSQPLTNEVSTVTSAINSMEADGGTNYTAALDKAYDYLNNRTVKDGRPGYVIFISDGAPGYSGESLNAPAWNGSVQAANIKNAGYTLYTVGIALGSDAAAYLKSLASADQNDHFINVTGNDYAEQLSETLKQWADKIKETPTTKPAGTGAVLIDVINTKQFEYVEGSATGGLTEGEDSEGNKTVTWNIGEIPEKDASVSFKIKAWAGVWGDGIHTNENVTLTYTDTKNELATMGKDVIGDPTVNIPAPQVTLTFDANGGSWETTANVSPYSLNENRTQATQAVQKFTSVASISVEPKRAGYEFDGRYLGDEKIDSSLIYVSQNTILVAHWVEIPATTYTVVYKDGLAYNKAFDDRSFPNLSVGEDTPDFGSTPTRSGYVFTGWTPTVAQKVEDPKDGSTVITYTATWEVDNWNSNDNSETGGDGIPDKYQALVKFLPGDPNGEVSGKTTQVITMPNNDKEYVSKVKLGSVEGFEVATTTPKSDFEFNVWTMNKVTDENEDEAKTAVTPKDVTVKAGSKTTFFAHFKAIPTTYTVTYTDGVDGEEIFADKVNRDLHYNDPTPNFGSDPTRDGYTFAGWEPTVANEVIGNATYVAQWEPKAATIKFVTNGGSDVKDMTGKTGDAISSRTMPTTAKSGHTFAGWYANAEFSGDAVTQLPAAFPAGTTTYYAKWNAIYVPYYPPVPPTVKIEDDDALGLNTTDHFAYIIGYGNGEVRPQNNITRAEVATIFFRLLTDDVRDENLTKTNRYSDVAATSWYNTAVSTLSSMGIITGYPDGTFRPNAAITRAEFAAIAARFDNDGDKTAAKFSDIASHWAKDEISIAYNNGWITGYPNGTFGPQRDITRAETMTLVNRVLNRQPETEDDLLPNMTVWTDNANPKAWYYLAVQEATNSHYYKFKTNSKYEKWTELRETRDWTQLEK